MRRSIRLALVFLFAFPCSAAFASVAAPQTPFVVPPVPALGVRSYVLLDARTGQILAQQRPDARVAPGGAAKLMTAYVVFQELRAGRVRLSSRLRISRTAWHQPGARMFLKPGAEVSVNDLLQGLLVDGGNDAAVALAEGVAGTRAGFVSLMNDYARELGLANTHFTNVTGLPSAQLYTSALDLARLSRDLLVQFPEYAHYFAQKSFRWSGITQYNYDKLLWRDPNAVGLAPGYAGRAAGYCMAAGATREHTQLIAAVMGMAPQAGASLARNLNTLARVSEALLAYGFRFYTTHELYKSGTTVGSLRVIGGAQRKISVGLDQPLYVTVPSGEYSALSAKAEFVHDPKAPVSKGQRLGRLVVRLAHKSLTSAPVVALVADPRGNLWQRLNDDVVDWLHSQKA
ncbi:MAG: D-alanyl-D-alanine carboxypeptidase [Acidihalobacter sp.]|uniref:D-alanyl-D-alanine carboxypeptidase family protein n=1 Tax=Acidihalobacter sp. TaxID=1872108 RepID=UPI00307F8C8F